MVHYIVHYLLHYIVHYIVHNIVHYMATDLGRAERLDSHDDPAVI